MVRQLVSRRAEVVNTPDCRGMLPLMYAVDNIDEKMMELLLELGAEPNLHNYNHAEEDAQMYDGLVPLLVCALIRRACAHATDCAWAHY